MHLTCSFPGCASSDKVPWPNSAPYQRDQGSPFVAALCSWQGVVLTSQLQNYLIYPLLNSNSRIIQTRQSQPPLRTRGHLILFSLQSLPPTVPGWTLMILHHVQCLPPLSCGYTWLVKYHWCHLSGVWCHVFSHSHNFRAGILPSAMRWIVSI